MKKIILLFLLLCGGLLNAQISLSEIQDTVGKGYVPITDYDPALATYIQKYMLLQDYLEDSISWASVPVGLHDAVTLAGSYDYITLSGQVITRNQIDLTTDVTGLLPYASLSGAPTLLSQFTDDLGHVEESTTVTDLANGLDISLSTYDITVSPDFVELTTETTIDDTDYIIMHDATTPNDGKITYANLLADIVSDASLDLYQVLTNGNDAGGLDALNFAEVEADEFIGDLRGAVLFKAQAGETLAKGDVVYVSGISGNTTIVSKADADDATKMPAFGVVAAAASSPNPVDIYTFGTLSNLNTSAYTIGDILYVSTTAGQLTATPPTGESALLQNIAKVTRVHASSGSIKISGAGRTNATPNLNTGRLFVGNASNQAVADGTMYVDIANSRVGIGTTPSQKLEVAGNIFTDNSGTGRSIRAYNASGNYSEINGTGLFSGGNMSIYPSGTGTRSMYQGLPSAEWLNIVHYLATGGSESWRFNNVLEVQITESGLDLTTVPTENTSDILTWGSTGLISKTTKASIIEDAGYWDRNSGSGYTYLANSGDNVGIGTTSPAKHLEIENTGADATMLVQTTDDYNAYIEYQNNAGGGGLNYRTGVTTSEHWDISSSAQTMLRIDRAALQNTSFVDFNVTDGSTSMQLNEDGLYTTDGVLNFVNTTGAYTTTYTTGSTAAAFSGQTTISGFDYFLLNGGTLEAAKDQDYFEIKYQDHDGATHSSFTWDAEWRFYEDGRLRVNAGSVNWYDLPASDGTANQYLKTDGSGNTSWSTITQGGNGIYDGSGSLSSSTTVTINGYGIDFVGSTDKFSIDSYGQTSWTEGSNSSSILQSGTGFYIQNSTSLGSIQLRTGSPLSTALYVKFDGNIGINTLNPSQKLEVAGNIFTTNDGTTRNIRSYSSTGAWSQLTGIGLQTDVGMSLYSNDDRVNSMFLGLPSAEWNNIIGYYSGSFNFVDSDAIVAKINATGLELYDTGGAKDIYLNPNGDSYIMNDLGISTSSPSAKLDVVGDTELNGEVTWSERALGEMYRLAEQSVTNGNTDKIDFATQVYQDGDITTDVTTNDRITVTNAGKYTIHLSALMSNDGTILDSGRLLIYKNGTQIADSEFSNVQHVGLDSVTKSISGILNLAASDYLEVYLQELSGTGDAEVARVRFTVKREIGY